MKSEIIGRKIKHNNLDNYGVNRDFSDSKQQYQSQIFSQVDVEVQQQLKMVIDDFKNVMGIAFETQAVLDTFQNDHEMVTIYLNRLFLQLNLSNGIHVDVDRQTRNKKRLYGQKQIAIDMTKKFMEKYQFDQRITDQIHRYLNDNLNQNPVIKQQALLPNNFRQFNLNPEIVQQVINSIGLVDMELNQLRNGNLYQIPTFEEVEKINLKRHERAMIKCFTNFQGQKLIQFLRETFSFQLPLVKEQFSQIIIQLKSKDFKKLNAIDFIQDTKQYIELFNQVHEQAHISNIFTKCLANNLKKDDLNLNMKDKVVIDFVHQILGLK